MTEAEPGHVLAQQTEDAREEAMEGLAQRRHRPHPDAVELRFSLTREEVGETAVAIAEQRLRAWGRLSGFVFGLLLLSVTGSLAAALLFFGFYTLLTGPLNRHAMRRHGERYFDKAPEVGAEQHWVVTDRDLYAWAPTSEMRMDWCRVQKAVELDEYFLLFPMRVDVMYYAIPKRAFAAVEDEQRFRELLREHVWKRGKES